MIRKALTTLALVPVALVALAVPSDAASTTGHRARCRHARVHTRAAWRTTCPRIHRDPVFPITGGYCIPESHFYSSACPGPVTR